MRQAAPGSGLDQSGRERAGRSAGNRADKAGQNGRAHTDCGAGSRKRKERGKQDGGTEGCENRLEEGAPAAPLCRLPEDFLERMKALLGDEYQAYLDSFENPCHNGLRINTLKISREEWERIAPFKTRPVPWIENGFYCSGEGKEEDSLSERASGGSASGNSAVRPSRHPYYYAGLYYLQEPSAMTPANLLPVEPGQRVLDLCAAPGGKSTELGAKLRGRGLLFANDISASRARALLKNLELFGIPNICVSSETPEKLCGLFPESFDRILVDAPCSGEGMFRKDADMVKSYRSRGPEEYAPIQRAILECAVKMLRPGGMLLYSTCTFDEEENEGTVRHILNAFPDMSLQSLPQREGFARGIGLPECVRLFPHRVEGEGHFLALLKKAERGEGRFDERSEGSHGSFIDRLPGGSAGSLPETSCSCGGFSENCFRGQEEFAAAESLKDKKDGRGKKGGKGNNRRGEDGQAAKPAARSLPDSAASFFSSLSWKPEPERICEKNGKLYYLPASFVELKSRGGQEAESLRFLRTGLYLGEAKQGRFEPSQALAMALAQKDWPSAVSFEAGDSRVIRYLKGETVALSEEELPRSREPWTLVCVDGYPLGWAKRAGLNLKNKYYPGWRWQ